LKEQDLRANIVCGDVREYVPKLPPCAFHGSLFDPPYGNEDMGSHLGWDESLPSVEVFRQLLRVTKPGGYTLCFGKVTQLGPLWMNIQDAGWEIVDVLMWLFAKRPVLPAYVDKRIDARLGARREVIGLNPGWKERNWRAFGDSAFANPVYLSKPATPQAKQFEGYANRLRCQYDPIILAVKPIHESLAANALRHGVAGLNIGASRIPASDKSLFPVGYSTGRHYNGLGTTEDAHPDTRYPGNVLLNADVANGLDETSEARPSRFFTVLPQPFMYVNQPTPHEKSAGLPKPTDHPCVKPIELTKWLATLILPPTPTSRLLVPYSGVGSEMIGAMLAGWHYVCGIEMNERYVEDSRMRLNYWGEKFNIPLTILRR